MSVRISRHKNNWFGFGIRATHSRGDFFIMVVRFAWWQWWVEYEYPERPKE